MEVPNTEEVDVALQVSDAGINQKVVEATQLDNNHEVKTNMNSETDVVKSPVKMNKSLSENLQDNSSEAQAAASADNSSNTLPCHQSEDLIQETSCDADNQPRPKAPSIALPSIFASSFQSLKNLTKRATSDSTPTGWWQSIFMTKILFNRL